MTKTTAYPNCRGSGTSTARLWRQMTATLVMLAAPGGRMLPAAAQQPGLSVTPMTIEADVQPGVAYHSTLWVASDPGAAALSQATTRVRVYAMDWTMLPDGTPTFEKAGTRKGCCSNWVEVNPAEFDLKPGQTQAIRYTLSVPKEARGTYHTVLMVEAGPPPSTARRGGTAVVGRLGAILYATAGPHHKSGRVLDFSATPTGMRLTLENDGADHLRLAGIVQIQDSSGKIVREEKIPPAVILPREGAADSAAPGAAGSSAMNTRRITLEWPALPAGDYLITAIVDYGGDELLGSETRIKAP